MSKVSKLVIKACSDNKFSSFIGEFITSINPENLVIKSGVSYHVPEGMPNASLLKYRASPPKLLSFSLLFDNTGIIPGSNTIAVMEQVKQLQDVAYNVQKKNNAPNYIRVIWGQIDFKGRLVDLNIVYSMFQVDGTLVRAEAHIAVLEELVPVGKGKSAAGVDGERTKLSGATATSKGISKRSDASPSYNEVGAPPSYDQAVGQSPDSKAFAPTPNGMNGAYSGAPPGAYNGGPDQVYQGSNGSGGAVYASSSVGATTGINKPPSNPNNSSVGVSPSSSSSSGFKGGVAGNGPGGSGGGIGGGGHSPGGGSKKAGGAAGTTSPATKSGATGSNHGTGSGRTGPAKSNVAAGSVGGATKEKGSGFKTSGIVVGGAAAAAAAAGGADSLRKVSARVNLMQKMKDKASFFRRLQKFIKKITPKPLYDAGKKLGAKI